MRLFIAILLSDKIKALIDRSAKEIKICTLKGHLTDIDNYHITLRFLGEVKEESLPYLQNALVETAKISTSFDLFLNGFGEFKKPDGSIIWLGIEKNSISLKDLHHNLENELFKAGYPKEPRSFSPHITLIRKARLSKPLSDIRTSFRETHLAVDQIALMESCRLEGKLTYIPLAVFPLKIY